MRRIPRALTTRRALTRTAGILGGSALPLLNKIFDVFNVTDDKYIDSVGQFYPDTDHEYRNRHLVGDGVTAIYFYAELDGENVHFYNVDTLSWVTQVYNHATGVTFGAGVNILEAYSDLGDVWTFEEDGCNDTLFNLKCECHGYIDATGVTLETFRSGRNDLVSRWGTSLRGLNTHAYGYSVAVAASGAAILTRFTEPVPLVFDITLTYGVLTSPIIYDYGNTLIDGTGDGYGMRVNTDFTLDFFRKDAGVITVLATATVGDYTNGCRVEMTYNIPNDKFFLKAYELGAVNPSDNEPVSDPTYPYPENDYQRLELPNGNETVTLVTDGVPEDFNNWESTDTVCRFYIPSAFTLSDDAIPVITGFQYDEVGNRLNAEGGLLEYVGMIKLSAEFVNSNCIDFSTTAPTMDFETPLAGGETLEYQGTAVLALSTTQITVTTIGTVYDLKVLDGETVIHHYAVAEGGEDTLYDLIGGNKITLNTFNLDDWSEQDDYHYNMVNGFDIYENTLGERLFVPIGSTVTQAGYELLDTFVQDGKSLLPCETDIVMPRAPILIASDPDNVLFDVSGTPIEVDWFDVINATALQEVIGIESTVGTDGQAQAVVEGLTVQNIVKENDFFSSTNWVLGGGAIISSGELSIPSGGSTAMQNVSAVDGDKMFVALRSKGTSLQAFGWQDDSANTFPISAGYEWHPLAKTYSSSGTQSFTLFSSGGGVFFDIVFIVNKTALGIEDWTEDQMLALVQTMVAGTDLQHVKNPILSANGKNQYNRKNEIIGEFYNLGVLTANAAYLNGGMQHVIAASNYTLSAAVSNFRWLCNYFDSHGVFVGFQIPTTGNVTITTPSNARYIVVQGRNLDGSPMTQEYADSLNIQLELGAVATTYEPFKSSEMTILSSGGADWIGRSLPNLVSDLSYTYFKKNVQNVKEYALQEGDIDLFTGVNTKVVFVNKQPDHILYNVAGLTLDFSKTNNIAGYGHIASFIDDTAYEYKIFNQSATKIGLIVPFTLFANVAEAKSGMSGKILDYQLAAPIITDAEITIVDENGNPQKYLHAYKDGQIRGEAEDLVPPFNYKNLQHGTQIFADTSRGNKKQRLVGYSEEQDGYALDRIYQALNK